MTTAKKDEVQVEDHIKVAHGKCPICHHYGDDCTGTLQQTTAVTQYTVQVRAELTDQQGTLLPMVTHGAEAITEVWVELGQYEVPSGARRKAIELAMADHDLEEGSFHTIPESSAGIETCRMTKKFSWD